MEIVLIRHFPTKGNRLKQYIGRTDEPLDESAVCIDSFYPKVDYVVTSPMKRCKQTAELLYLGTPAFSCELLKETDFGDFEGRTYEELKDNEDYRQWLMNSAEGSVPNGESRAAFVSRSISGFCEVMDKLMEMNVNRAAIIIHGGTIMALMSEFAEEKQEFYHWQVKNGKGYVVHVDTELWRTGNKVFTDIRKL